ncbi:D -box ATP-dependent RNA helicase D 3 isoform X1, partial [Olea europaea subsp. europaea]
MQLQDSSMDIHKEGKYLMLSVQELVSGGQCKRRFVFGRENKMPREPNRSSSPDVTDNMLKHLGKRGNRILRYHYMDTILLKLQHADDDGDFELMIVRCLSL